MDINPIHIKFQNKEHPSAAFDVVPLEVLQARTDLDHSPFQPHLVEFFIVFLVLEGEGEHTIDFTDYHYQRGTVLTIRKDQIHRFYPSHSVKGKLLLFTDDFLVSYLEKLEALKSLQLFNEVLGVPKIQLEEQALLDVVGIVERIEREYFQDHDDYSLGIIRSELHILIAKLYRLKAQQEQVITQRKYLSEFVSFQNLVEQHATQYSSVQAYAKLMGVSTKTLNTITKHVVHKTAKEFVDEICTKQIKRLLINTDLSVKEVAYAAGFEESTNFYKYFKRQTQLTPEQFRASY